MSNVKCKMSIRLNFCRSVPPELLRSFLYFSSLFIYYHCNNRGWTRRRSARCWRSRSSTSSWTTTRLTTWTRTRLKAQISMLGSFIQRFFSNIHQIPNYISIYSCTFSRTVSILRMVSRQLIMFDIDITASFFEIIKFIITFDTKHFYIELLLSLYFFVMLWQRTLLNQ